MVKLLFHAWLDDYKESRRAKHWFNREAGPEGEGEDESEWCWPEGEDHISLLPREIAIKVFYRVIFFHCTGGVCRYRSSCCWASRLSAGVGVSVGPGRISQKTPNCGTRLICTPLDTCEWCSIM